MSVIIKEIFMDWLDINEFHNVRIDSKSKCYTDTLSCDEEFYLMAKTNADDGDAVEIHLNLLDKNQAILKIIELESHVENEEVKMTFKIEDLAKENLLDFNAIKEINAEFHYENEKYPTNKARVCRTLKSKELSDSSELNDIVEGKVAKTYKKGKGTVPNSKGDEIKLIQTSLQKMKINIGDDGVDGVFGNDGHNAIMTFQENYKPTHNVHQYAWAEPDGIVGKNTLLAMDEALVSGWKHKKKCDCTSKFHKISKIILKHEGGFVNDPDDPGGATNKGIAWPTWQKYAKSDLNLEPTLYNLEQLSDNDAEIIYRKRYWEPKGFCQLENNRVGLMVYDWTITSGGAAKKVQELLNNEFFQNLTITKTIDRNTINALNIITDQNKLLGRITDLRKEYYQNLAYKNGQETDLKKYLKGWLNRVDDCLGVSI